MAYATADGSPPPPAEGLTLLTLPGLDSSGPEHWQTRWEGLRPDITRVEQRNWAKPDLAKWSRRAEKAILSAAHPVVLIAHSFGCLTAVHAADRLQGRVAGALLVAPADPDKFGVAAQLPSRPLAYPSLLVGSTNDPWLSATKARELACAWGTRYTELQGAGHINADSGFGPWPQGLRLLDELLATVLALRTSSHISPLIRTGANAANA